MSKQERPITEAEVEAPMLTGDEVMEAIKAHNRGEELAPDIRAALKTTLQATSEEERPSRREANRRDAHMFGAGLGPIPQ